VDGTGGIEVSEAWYAREAHSTWQNVEVGVNAVRRVNVGAIEMDAHSGTDTVIVGWGIFAALTGGDPRHWGPLRSATGTETPVTLTGANQLRWTDGTMRVQFKQSADQTEALEMVAVYGPTATIDATPTPVDIYTLDDEEGVTLEVDLIARHTTAGATDYHYYRKVRVSYARDDGGSGTTLWTLREQTPDGAETRITLTTATATIVKSGNTLRAQFTGEAATNITWFAVVRSVSDAMT
jgi:hypothetical protein